jgi:hypothetical protein
VHEEAAFDPQRHDARPGSLEVYSCSKPLTLKTAALCESSRRISWMTPNKVPRRWLENASPLEKMAVEELPLGPLCE